MNIFKRSSPEELKVFEFRYLGCSLRKYGIENNIDKYENASTGVVTSYKLSEHKQLVKEVVEFYKHLDNKEELAKGIYEHIDRCVRIQKSSDAEVEFNNLKNRLIKGDF